jgi:FlaA1/EpsC-like NDP-sugar epimerase
MLFGSLKSIYFAISCCQFINRHLIRTNVNLIERYGKGSWTVVTGAGDGIGAEFCRQLSQ